ncbi:MmgE/PrpD family protein [Propylenella binzhouense]|nr:MmgE/PrpD family protein [Propylenella binzhouense]
MATAIETIAQWAAGTPPITSPAARQKAARGIVDTVAVMLAGSAEPAAIKALTALRACSGPVTAFPDARLAAPFAALVNGTAAHAMDFDDGENVGFTHVSAVLVPALLALGEERHASGAASIDAYIVGVEAIVRVGEWIGVGHYGRGWHSTSTVAALGAAAACARLIGLDAVATGRAISIAASMAGGFRSQFGTMVKPLHAGFGAKSGVLAAILAEAGIDGSNEALDGRFGFDTLMADKPKRTFAEAVQLGAPLWLEDFCPSAKRFAACGSTHGALDAILELKAEHAFSLADVAAFETMLPDISYSTLIATPPANEMEARFSLEHCAAVAIDKGALALADFAPHVLTRPDYLAFRDRVTIHPYDGTNAYRDGVYWTRTEITLRDGRVLATEVTDKRGSSRNPLSDQDLADKFRMCAGHSFDLRGTDAILARLFAIDAVPDIAGLLSDIRSAIVLRMTPPVPWHPSA